MTGLLLMAVLALAPPQPDWTWSLYDDAGSVVLADEIPDTPQLRATLECQPGSGVTHIVLYGPGGAGIATLTAGGATAAVQAQRAQGDRLELALRTDHPVFQTFATDGMLNVRIGDQTRTVDLKAQRTLLRQFAHRCGG